MNGTPHSVGRSVATEINNHPELPGVQKYGAFPRRIVHEKVNAGLPGKVDQVLRGPLEERGRDRKRKRGEKNRRKRLWDSFRSDAGERDLSYIHA